MIENLAHSLDGSTHDCDMGPWGPFSKRHVGVSHIPDVRSGLRVDFFYAGGLYRRTARLPHALHESGWHPWIASPDLSRYRLRHQILWKNLVYVDVDYCRLDEKRVLVATHLVNSTKLDRSLSSHLFASIAFPPLREHSNEPVRTIKPRLPEGGRWLPALEYASMEMSAEPHRRALVNDGHRYGEGRAHDSVDGSVLANGFGRNVNDRVSYRKSHPDGVWWMRWRLPKGARVDLSIEGASPGKLVLHGNGQFQLTRLDRCVDHDEIVLRVTKAEAGMEFDGFVLGSPGEAPVFDPQLNDAVPDVTRATHGALITYGALPGCYGISWSPARPVMVRQFFSSRFDEFFARMTHEHTSTILREGQADHEHHLDIFVGPIPVPAGSVQSEYYLLCEGDEDWVRAEVENFQASDYEHWESVIQAVPGVSIGGHPAGDVYRSSQERLAAVTLTNVVYPVRTRGTWIRHHCPGRWWDCLYTWDSGFIGLGMAELNIRRSAEILNAYLTESGTSDAAFIHHGSPIPVQHYLGQELWNRTLSRELVEYCYPGLAQYHRFLAGRSEGATTRMSGSGLLRTFDYFYNSGGWDDYPAQAAVHRDGLSASVAPVVNTAHAVRTARILRQLARLIGEPPEEWDRDIADFQRALEAYAWDEASGYYSYVCHNADGQPTGHLVDTNGVNFNRGFDGISPLVGGVNDPGREERLIEKLQTPGILWSNHGLTAVDQSAPYFNSDGYWNGAIWMPHQWFFWKSLLDVGASDLAWRIASTALNLWQRETDDSHCCFEHFLAASGTGAGWHHFSGLSTPVLLWFGAHFRGPRLTTGFNVLRRSEHWRNEGRRLEAELESEAAPWQEPIVLVTLADESSSAKIRAAWNGSKLESRHRVGACHEVTLPKGGRHGILTVEV